MINIVYPMFPSILSFQWASFSSPAPFGELLVSHYGSTRLDVIRISSHRFPYRESRRAEGDNEHDPSPRITLHTISNIRNVPVYWPERQLLCGLCRPDLKINNGLVHDKDMTSGRYILRCIGRPVSPQALIPVGVRAVEHMGEAIHFVCLRCTYECRSGILDVNLGSLRYSVTDELLGRYDRVQQLHIRPLLQATECKGVSTTFHLVVYLPILRQRKKRGIFCCVEALTWHRHTKFRYERHFPLQGFHTDHALHLETLRIYICLS